MRGEKLLLDLIAKKKKKRNIEQTYHPPQENLTLYLL